MSAIKLNNITTVSLYALILVSFSLPYARISIGIMPLYFTTITSIILLSYSLFVFQSKKMIFFNCGIFGLLVYLFVVSFFHTLYLETSYIFYNNLIRILSLSVIFSLGVLIYNNYISTFYLLKIIQIGLKVHIILILIHFLFSLMGNEYLDFYYRLIYKIISNSEKFYLDIEKFQKDWYMMRYYGGYHNPNPAGVVLVLGYIIMYLSKAKLNILWFSLMFFCIILTASKQSFALLLLFLIVINLKKLPIYIILGFIFFELLLVFNFYDYLERIIEFDNYSTSADERSWGYLNFENFISNNFLGALLGTGVNSLGLREISNIDIESSKVGFVSNSVLLVISTIGIIGIVLLFRVFYLIRRASKNKKELLIFFAMVFFIGLFDNHIATMESLQIIIIIGILIIANITKPNERKIIH